MKQVPSNELFVHRDEVGMALNDVGWRWKDVTNTGKNGGVALPRQVTYY